MDKPEGAKYSEYIAKHYDVSDELQPTKVDFGAQWGNVEMDLRSAGKKEVDKFIAAHPKQQFFKLKTGVAVK